MLHDQLLQNSSLTFDGNIFRQNEFIPPFDFERTYLAVRGKEGRIYTDEEVRKLPKFHGDRTLQQEWMRRSSSFKKMKAYAARRSKPVVLEIGCGNGWFANGLAQLPDAQICGVDVNETELRQAARVFREHKNLSFLFGDVLTTSFDTARFDLIILAACAPYFNDLSQVIDKLTTITTDNGEIHILDSPFYNSVRDKLDARQRSLDHYNRLGFPEMANRYFHHSFDDLRGYQYNLHFDPTTLASRIKRALFSPEPVFPWIIIHK